jgi:dCMP deaminase
MVLIDLSKQICLMTMTNKWDKAYMTTAGSFAQLSSAKRLQVGCVIVKDNRIVSVGYNGMPSGWDNKCEDRVLYDYGNRSSEAKYQLKTKPEVLHAETNAIAKMARSPESAEDASLYTTHAPCFDCSKLIYQSGIKSVFYKEEYRSNDGLTFLRKCGIIVEKMKV